MHGVRRIGVFALAAALIVVLGALRPSAQVPEAEADLASPGGIAALPSAAPAVPGLNNQSIPAMIGTGQPGIVAVFCLYPLLPVGNPAAAGYYCPGALTDAQGVVTDAATITFEMERLYPTDGSPPALTFDANGDHTLVVADNGGGDMDAAPNVVTVRVNAAAATLAGTQGVNEIVEVIATDESGARRSVQVIVIDTILAFGPTGPFSTAAQEQPLFVAYHCDVVGRSPLVPGSRQDLADPDLDLSQGLDDMYDGLYTDIYDGIGPGFGYGSNTNSAVLNPFTERPDADLQDVWCGGNTAGSLFDDFVDFQTDKGLFSIEPVAQSLKGGAMTLADALGYFFPPIVDTSCGKGKSVDVFDVDALFFWSQWLTVLGGGAPFSGPFEGGCDATGWRDSVVAAMLLGNGEEGTATVNAIQGGGTETHRRTVNAQFVGLPFLSLFLERPDSMGLEGGEFTVAVVADQFRFVGDETISCTLDPPQSGYIIVPQTGTTGSVTSDTPAQVVMRIVPTGAAVLAGESLTVMCQLDRYPNVKAVAVIPLASFETEAVDLVPGCSLLSATWPDETPIATVAEAVAPPEALDAVWAFDAETGTWQGFSAANPEVSDLMSVDQLDAIFVCVNASSTIARPVIEESGASAEDSSEEGNSTEEDQ